MASNLLLARRQLQPPLNLAVTADDFLRVQVQCSNANAAVEVRIRLLDEDGAVRVLRYTPTMVADRSTVVSAFPLAPGYILGGVVLSLNTVIRRGECFVSVGLHLGSSSTPTSNYPLFSGYIVAPGIFGWPGTPQAGSLDGPGLLRSIVGTDPAAGVEIAQTVPTGARWRLRSIRATLVTSAVVANRTPLLTIDDGTFAFFRSQAASPQLASTTLNYTAAAVGVNPALIGVEQVIPLPPDLMLLQGWRFRTSTPGLDPGDNWAAPQFCVEEWLEP